MPEDAPDAASPLVHAEFTLLLGETALTANVNLPVGQTTLTAILPILQNLDNAIVDAAGKEAAQAGKSISCRAGCGACCRQLVPVSLFEAEALTAWIGTLPPPQRSELERRFHLALSALRDAGVLEKVLDHESVLEQEQITQLGIDYFHAGVACPFLENESCSIYPIRPLSCREYLVTSPAELCRDPAANQVAGLRLPVKLSRALFAIGRSVEQGSRGWFPLVFLLAWAESGATPGAYVSGSGHEVLGRFLDQVTGASGAAKKDPAQ